MNLKSELAIGAGEKMRQKKGDQMKSNQIRRQKTEDQIINHQSL